MSDFWVLVLLTLPLLFAGGLVLFMATGRESKPTTQELIQRREQKKRSEQGNPNLAPHPNQPSKL